MAILDLPQFSFTFLTTLYLFCSFVLGLVLFSLFWFLLLLLFFFCNNYCNFSFWTSYNWTKSNNSVLLLRKSFGLKPSNKNQTLISFQSPHNRLCPQWKHFLLRKFFCQKCLCQASCQPFGDPAMKTATIFLEQNLSLSWNLLKYRSAVFIVKLGLKIKISLSIKIGFKNISTILNGWVWCKKLIMHFLWKA